MKRKAKPRDPAKVRHASHLLRVNHSVKTVNGRRIGGPQR